MLDICVTGFYLEKYDDFYMSLHRLKDRHNVFVVSHKESDYLKVIDLPYCIRENTGLEFGAYNHYLMNIWEGKNNILFCHDDIVINPTVVEGYITPPEYLFDRFESVGVDQAYVFGSRHEDVENYGKHGRMIYVSRDFAQKAKDMGGFWYDEKNRGYTNTEDSHLRDEYGCFAYNAGINAFHGQAQEIGGDVHRKIFIPAFEFSKRGEKAIYGKWSDKVSRIIEFANKKMHIGCGDNYFDSHTNVDLYSDKADIKAHATDIPVQDETYDLVESHHLFEHLEKSEVTPALKEWQRILRKGGHVFLSCPDILAVCDSLKKSEGDDWDKTMRIIYGEEGKGMAHRYGYSRESLTAILKEAGFVDVDVKTAIGYRPTPSLLAIARK